MNNKESQKVAQYWIKWRVGRGSRRWKKVMSRSKNWLIKLVKEENLWTSNLFQNFLILLHYHQHHFHPFFSSSLLPFSIIQNNTATPYYWLAHFHIWCAKRLTLDIINTLTLSNLILLMKFHLIKKEATLAS